MGAGGSRQARMAGAENGGEQHDDGGDNIPHICHFFTRAKFLENKIYTEKRQFFALNL